MASPTRQTPDPLALQNVLRDRPESFEFFEALRWLECAYPDKPRFGHSAKPAEDAVRLCQTPSLAFAPRTVERFEQQEDGKPPRMYGLFFGLFGPNAPLPLHLTEYALDRKLNARDSTFIAFADIFHHRMLSLFYRCWADAQPTVQLDRPGEDRFSLYMGALVGLSTPNLQARDVLFVDEIHRLSPIVEEVLYAAMEDYQLDIMIGEGPAARSIKVNLPPFTLVGATTRAGLLTSPLRDRFGIVQRLEFYEVEDLERIVKLALRLLFYGAPVLYRLDIKDPVLHFLYGVDPLAGIFDLYRACFFPQVLDWGYVLQSVVVTAIIFVIGVTVFRRSVPRVLKEI